VFCPSVDVRYQLRHELHMAIDQAFREAGIVIAFPQRDIHVRTISDELPIRQHPPGTEDKRTIPSSEPSPETDPLT
jgi:potassium efflux system protein